MLLSSGTLNVSFHQARGLRETQTIGRQDPFVVAAVEPAVVAGGSRKRTLCCDGGGSHPVWGLEHRNQVAFPLTDDTEALVIEIWNENWTVHDIIGTVRVPLAAHFRGGARLSACRWLPVDTGGELQVTLFHRTHEVPVPMPASARALQQRRATAASSAISNTRRRLHDEGQGGGQGRGGQGRGGQGRGMAVERAAGRRATDVFAMCFSFLLHVA